jgi:hypothetical protein
LQLISDGSPCWAEQPAVAEAFALIGEFTQLRSQSVSGDRRDL